MPPKSRQLIKLAQDGKCPVAKHCEIHVGERDWQSNPDIVRALAKLTGWGVTVVKGAGHMMPADPAD